MFFHSGSLPDVAFLFFGMLNAGMKIKGIFGSFEGGRLCIEPRLIQLG